MTSRAEPSPVARSGGGGLLPKRRGQGTGDASLGPVGVRSVGSVRQRQLSWVALGVLLVVMSMLGFALWSIRQARRVPVLVAAHNIDAGSVIERGDLALVLVGAGPGLSVVEVSQEEQIIGRAARGPIPSGTPLSWSLVVTEADAVPTGRAVVGATLEAGDYPTPALQAGDRVKLVETTPAGVPAPEATGLELGEASVWAVEPLPGSSRPELFVSLLVDQSEAAAVSTSASAGQLRLVLVGAGS